MKLIAEIAKKELRIFLFSPLGWLVLLTFVLQLGSFLTSSLSSRTDSLWRISEFTPSLTFNMLFGSGITLITGISVNLYLYLPLLTMGLFSREYSEGTIKLLFSSTARVRDIVLGKFVAIATVGAILVGVVASYGLVLHFFVIKNMDLSLLLWGLIMLYLLICSYAAIGLFVSSLTSYQFVAALGTVGFLFFLDYASRLSVTGMPEWLSSVLLWFRGTSFIYYFKGFIGTWDILYYFLLMGLFLGLTFLRLHFIRTSAPARKRILYFTALVLGVLMIGYISSMPAFKYYSDLREEVLTDTTLKIARENLGNWRVILMQVIPVFFLLLGTGVILRRKWR